LKLLLATVFIAVTMGVMTSTAQGTVLQLHHKSFTHMTRTEKIHYLKRQKWHDNSIIRWWHNHRELAGTETTKDVKWAKQSLRIVQRNLHALLTPVVSASSGVISALLCIHRYEGSWDDPNPPYWGGLQMDLTFQQTYGNYYLRHLGTADHWPIAVQLQVAARAVASRGYSPWPNTARDCGLL
jgi:hypothetical protein